MLRPIMHSHLTEHAAVARATAGKVLARECARLAEILLQLSTRVPPSSFSTGLALSSVDSLRRQGTQG